MGLKLYVKKLRSEAITPKYMTKGSVAFDVCSARHDFILSPKEFQFVYTGLAFEIPEGYEMQVRQRSGLSIKYPNYIVIGTGTIDQDYRGELMVPVKNNSESNWLIEYGSRIAQCIISPIKKPDIKIVEELSQTGRGTGGFGSTG